MSSKLFLHTVKFRGGTDATSATDQGASIVVTGGVSISESLWAGTSINASSIFQDGSQVANLIDIPIAGSGLTKTGSTFSVDYSSITTVGTLTGLTSNGIVSILDTTEATAVNTGALQVNGGIYSGGNVYVSGNVNASTSPTVGSHLTNKTYVDGLSYLTAGTGLTLSGSTLVVNAIQTGITSLGTLTGLTSSGVVNIINATDSTSIGTGALTVSGGISSGRNIYVGGNVNASTAPTVGAHLANKTYVDGLSYLTAGIGVTLSGSTLNVNATQTGITSVGTLIGLTSSGIVSVTNTLDSTSTITGALQVAGGAAIAKTLFLGAGSGGPQPVAIGISAPATAINAACVLLIQNAASSNNWGIYHAGSAGTANLANGSLGFYSYTAGFHSFQLKQDGTVFCASTTDSTSTTTGALQVAGGIGLKKSLVIGTASVVDGILLKNGNNFSNNRQLWITDSTFTTNGTNPAFRVGLYNGTAYIGAVSTDNLAVLPLYVTSPMIMTSTTDSTSTTTGAFQMAGGIGLQKSMYVGGHVQITGGVVSETVAGINRIDIGLNGTPRILLENSSGKIWEIDSDATGSFRLFQPGKGVLTIDGTTSDVSMSSTTDSTSTTTGALQVQGGLGIAKSLFVGSNVNASNVNANGNVSAYTTTVYGPSNVYPPQAMNALSKTFSGLTYGNGTYTVTASGTYVNNYSYNAFDQTSNTWASSGYTTSGTYTGAASTTVDGTTVMGEWIQLALPNGIMVRSIVISWNNSFFALGTGPTSLMVVGSNDGTTWTSINSTLSISWPTKTSSNTFPVYSVSTFTYLRVVTMTIGNGAFAVAIPEMSIYGTEDVLPGTTTNALRVAGSGILSKNLVVGGTMSPAIDNTSAVGSTSNRWTAVYAVNGTIQTSDENLKSDIKPLEIGLDFVKKLKPIAYKMPRPRAREGQDEATFRLDKATEKLYTAHHMGVSAQQVREAIKYTGLKDFAGVVQAEDGTYMMNYSQLIAPLIKAIQEVTEMRDKDRDSIKYLKNRLITLEEMITTLSNRDRSNL